MKPQPKPVIAGPSAAQRAARQISSLSALTLPDLQRLYAELYGAPTSLQDRLELSKACARKIGANARGT